MVLRRLVSTPRSVAATVFVAYGGWIAAVLGIFGSPYTFVNPGRQYIQLAARQGIVLPAMPGQFGGTAANPHLYGYDGQFTYYIALHPGRAKTLLDVPWYRYQRILEPMLVKVLSAGSSTLVPWLMLAISWLSVVVGTWAVASWLSSKGRRPGWALLYGFWPGLVVTVRNDLTDGLAYGLVAVALLLLDSPTRSRPGLAAAVISMAVFARQEVAIYAAMMALGIGFGVFVPQGIAESPPLRSRIIRAQTFGIIAIAPFCIYLLFLSNWLHGAPGQVSAPITVPGPEMLADVLLLVLPAIVSLGAFVPDDLRARSQQVWAWSTYGAHVLALTGFMLVGRIGVYYSWSFSTVFRYYIPVALGALICYGCVTRPAPSKVMSLMMCSGLAMAAFPILAATGL